MFAQDLTGADVAVAAMTGKSAVWASEGQARAQSPGISQLAKIDQHSQVY